MGIGASILLIAAGAILRFAIATNTSHGVDLQNVGLILMVIGAIGLVMTALIWGPRTRRTTIEDNTGRRVTAVTRDGL